MLWLRLLWLRLLLLRVLRRQAAAFAATASRYPGPRSRRGAGWNGSFSVSSMSNLGRRRRRRLDTGGSTLARGRVAWSQGRQGLATAGETALQPQVRHHRQHQGHGEAQHAITGAHRAVQAEREGQTKPTPEERCRQRSLPRVRIQAHHQR